MTLNLTFMVTVSTKLGSGHVIYNSQTLTLRPKRLRRIRPWGVCRSGWRSGASPKACRTWSQCGCAVCLGVFRISRSSCFAFDPGCRRVSSRHAPHGDRSPPRSYPTIAISFTGPAKCGASDHACELIKINIQICRCRVITQVVSHDWGKASSKKLLDLFLILPSKD